MIKHYRQITSFSLLLVFKFITSCNGQDLSHLPQGSNAYASVRYGVMDKTGNLWFGTTGLGVYYYEGASVSKKGETGQTSPFIHYTEQNGLSNGNVNCILEDKAGNMWVGTNDGVFRHDVNQMTRPNGKTFTLIPIVVHDDQSSNASDKNKADTSQPAVRTILQDKNGNLWFGTDEGVFRYDMHQTGSSERKEVFTRFLQHDNVGNKKNLRLHFCTCILEDKKGNIWFTTWFEGICCYGGKSITNFKPNGKVWFSSIFEDKKGNLWFGSRDSGPYRLDAGQNDTVGKGYSFTTFANIPIFNKCCPNAMTQDTSGNIWFCTEFDDLVTRDDFGGAWCYHPSASGQTSPKDFTNFTIKDGLTHNSVWSVTCDKSGKLWFGTRGLGLCRYDNPMPDTTIQQKRFTDYSQYINENAAVLIPDGMGGFRKQ
jgi:ligand-binding sensor domain-containing protein